MHSESSQQIQQLGYEQIFVWGKKCLQDSCEKLRFFPHKNSCLADVTIYGFLRANFFPFVFVTGSLRIPPNMPCCCEVGKPAMLSKNPAHFYWYFIDVPDLLRRPPPSNYAPKAKPLYSNFSLEMFCTSEFIGGLSILVGLFSPKEEVVGNFAANKIVGQNKMRAILIIHNEGTVLSHFLCPLAPI